MFFPSSLNVKFAFCFINTAQISVLTVKNVSPPDANTQNIFKIELDVGNILVIVKPEAGRVSMCDCVWASWKTLKSGV